MSYGSKLRPHWAVIKVDLLVFFEHVVGREQLYCVTGLSEKGICLSLSTGL